MAKTTINITFPDGARAEGVLETEFDNWDVDVAWSGEAADRIPDPLRHIAPAFLDVLVPGYLPDVQFDIRHEGEWLPSDNIIPRAP